MHELGYTKEVVRTVVEVAERSGACEARAVYLNIGEVRDIVDDLFCLCFSRLARNTIAQDCAVHIERIPLTLECRRCGRTFRGDAFAGEVRCPGCQERDYEVRTGMEFGIDHIEVA